MNLNPFKKKPSKPQGLRALVGTVPSSIEWRESSYAIAASILSSNDFRIILSIMENERPSRVGVLPEKATETDVVRAYEFNHGYDYCLLKLLSLAEPYNAFIEPKETFRDDTETDEDKL